MGFRVLTRSIKFEKLIFNGETRFEKLLNQRVATLVLFGLITSIFSNFNFYLREKLDKTHDIQYFEMVPIEKITPMFDIFKANQELTPYPILEAEIGKTIHYSIQYDEKKYRQNELYEYNTKNDTSAVNIVHLVFDNKYMIHLLCKLNMIKTSLNFLVLVLDMISFNYSTKNLQ